MAEAKARRARRDTVRVVLTLLVRDEADIVEWQLLYHYACGIDFVVATDHRSVDGTTEILRRFEGEGRLRYIREDSERIDQAGWMTRMSRIAATEHAADWVIPSDADEFWWPRRGSFHEVLDAIPAEVGVVRGFIRTFAPRPEDGRPFFERMTLLARPVDDHEGIYLPNVHVLHRSHPSVNLIRGFHDAYADGLGRLIRGWCPFEVLHFPNRSPAQTARKYEQASQAWQDHESGGGAHVLASYRELQTVGQAQLFESRIVRDEQIETGLRQRVLVNDTRLRDVLRDVEQGRPLAPLLPTPEQDAEFHRDLAAMRTKDAAARLIAQVKSLERRIAALG